ncbi:MAG: TIGR02757 family protein [Verrucomicrobia bacterium]|nr:TIGR02757 family protein [Cytophagales bacterium]
MESTELKYLLDCAVEKHNQFSFIKNDPISIPHLFSKKQDIEIAGLLAAVLAWGQRKTILNKCQTLMQYFDLAPHDFMLNHTDSDLKTVLNFKHRTFKAEDLLYFITFFKHYYQNNESLETAFSQGIIPTDTNVGKGLENFRVHFFGLNDFPQRTKKHISSPVTKSACKRLNMFLRWMVRKDDKGVDFGIWQYIKPSQLVCPCDVHVDRIARKLNLISRKNTDWQTAIELTDNLKKLDAEDPVKYDFALFGLGLEKF